MSAPTRTGASGAVWPVMLGPLNAVPPLAAATRELIETAVANGWLAYEQHQHDSGGAPFVTVHLRSGYGDDSTVAEVTWHTRGTGTYRLFGGVWRRMGSHGRHWGRDVPSMRKLREHIAAHPQDPTTAAENWQQLWKSAAAAA